VVFPPLVHTPALRGTEDGEDRLRMSSARETARRALRGTDEFLGTTGHPVLKPPVLVGRR
jgi:hypothetical protein